VNDLRGLMRVIGIMLAVDVVVGLFMYWVLKTW